MGRVLFCSLVALVSGPGGDRAGGGQMTGEERLGPWLHAGSQLAFPSGIDFDCSISLGT